MAITKFKHPNNTAGPNGPITHTIVFTYEDIADNATSSNQVTLATIPAGGALYLAMVDEETALAGASDITLDVGTTSGDPDEFIDALDVDAMTAPVYNTGDAFVASNGAGMELVGATATATPVLAEWNGTVASLTAGRVIIHLGIADARAAANL